MNLSEDDRSEYHSEVESDVILGDKCHWLSEADAPGEVVEDEGSVEDLESDGLTEDKCDLLGEGGVRVKSKRTKRFVLL